MNHILIREYLMPNKEVGCICTCEKTGKESSATLIGGNQAKCNACGSQFDVYIPTHTHSYTAGDKQYVGSADVCYKITYTCSCGDTYTTDYTHPGFTQSSTAGSGDVCYTKYDVCTDPNCGYSKNYQDVAHNYELSESDPEEDYDIYECSECHKQQSRTR